MRNLEHDKNFIEQILAATPAEIPPMFAEIAALHAIERAIVAESKLLLAVKGLKWYADDGNHRNLVSFGHASTVSSDSGSHAKSILSEIERLSHA